MSLGANLENTTIGWLDRVTKTSTGTVERQNRVLRVGVEHLVQELSTVYGKVQEKGKGQYEAQQLYARLQNTGELLPPAVQQKLQAFMAADLAAAQKLGSSAATDLAKLIGNTSDTLKQTAKPNIPAINNAGKRLGDFWAKENTLFRDRVTALTQTAAATGKSWRLLSGQVRELLLLERKAGTESARSTAVNSKLGITARAELIARTEMQTAFVQGKISRFREMGYGWARWSAGSERTCPYCISRDGLVYPLEDVETSIPAHPRCRCSLIPVESPDGWGKGDNAVDAVGDLDDAYWAESRQKKLQDYQSDHPEFTTEQMIRYVNTPTNTQNYLRPGDPAPKPVWAPTGSLVPNMNKLSASLAAAIAQAQLLGAKKKELEEQAKKEAEELKKAQELLAKLQAEQEKADSEALLELAKTSLDPAAIKQVSYDWDGLTKAEKVALGDIAMGPVKKLIRQQLGITPEAVDSLIDWKAKLKLYQKASDQAFDFVAKYADHWQPGDKAQWDYSTMAQQKVDTVESLQKTRADAKIVKQQKKVKAEEDAKIEAANEDAAIFELASSIYLPKDKKLYKDQWNSDSLTDKLKGLNVADKQIKNWIEGQTGVTASGYDGLPSYQAKAQLLKKASDMAWDKLLKLDPKFTEADKPWWDKNTNLADKKTTLADALASDLALKQKVADEATADAQAKVGTPDEGIFRDRAIKLQEAADAAKDDLAVINYKGQKLFEDLNTVTKAVADQKNVLAKTEADLAKTSADLVQTETALKKLEDAFQNAEEIITNQNKRKIEKTAEWEKLTSELSAKQGLLTSTAGTDMVDPKAVRKYNEELAQQQHTLDSLMEVGRDVLRRAGIDDVTTFAGDDPQMMLLQQKASDTSLELTNKRLFSESVKVDYNKEIKKFEKAIAKQVSDGQQKYADLNTKKLEKLKIDLEIAVERASKSIELAEQKLNLARKELATYATNKPSSSDPLALAKQVISELINSSPLSRAQAEALVKEAASPAARKLKTNSTLRPVKDLSAMVDAVQMFGSRLTMDAYGLNRDRASAVNRRTLFSEANGQGDVKFGQNIGSVDSGNLLRSSFRQTQFHELGHHLEFVNNDIYTTSWEFINGRAAGSKSVPLKKLDPTRNYGPDEYAFEGQAISHYVLKDYRRAYQKQYSIDGKLYFPENDRRWQVLGDATEVISMGVEHLSSPALLIKLAAADPNHLLMALGTVRLSQARSSQVDPGQLNTFLADVNDGTNKVTMKTVAKQEKGKSKSPEELKALTDEVAEIERKRGVLEKQLNKLTQSQVDADANYLRAKEALDTSDLTKLLFETKSKKTSLSEDLAETQKFLDGFQKSGAAAEKALIDNQDKAAGMQKVAADKQVVANTAKALADLRDVGMKNMSDSLSKLGDTDLTIITKDVGVNLEAFGKAEKVEWLYAIDAGATPPLPNNLSDVMMKPTEAYAKLKTPEPVADSQLSVDDAVQLGKKLFEGLPDLDAQFDAVDIKVVAENLGIDTKGLIKSEQIDLIYQLLGGSDANIIPKKWSDGSKKELSKGKDALDQIIADFDNANGEYNDDGFQYNTKMGDDLDKLIVKKDTITSGDDLFTEMFGTPPPSDGPSAAKAKAFGEMVFEGGKTLDQQFDALDIKVIANDLKLGIGSKQALEGASKAQMIDAIHQLIGGSDTGLPGYVNANGKIDILVKGKAAFDIVLDYESDLVYDKVFADGIDKFIAKNTSQPAASMAAALPKPPFDNILEAVAYGEKVFGTQLNKSFNSVELVNILTPLGVKAKGLSKKELVEIVHQLAGENTFGIPSDGQLNLPKNFAEYMKTKDNNLYIKDPSQSKPKAELEAEFVNEYWFQGKMNDKGMSDLDYLKAGPGLQKKLLQMAVAEAQKKGITAPDFEVLAQPGGAKPAAVSSAPVAAKLTPPPLPKVDLPNLKVEQLKALFKATGSKIPKGTKADLVAAMEAMEASYPIEVRSAWAQLQQEGPKKKIVIKEIEISPLEPVTYAKQDFDFDNRGLVLDGVTLQAGPTLSGSTRPVLYLDPATGQAVYVLKGGGGSDPSGQNQAEWVTQKIYNLLATKEIRGVESHKVTDPSGKIRLANKYVEGAKTIDKLSAKELADLDIWRKVRSTHAADALVANWDYIGLSNDNIALGADGKLYKIDAGGTLNYRAQGTQKDFGDFPMELWTLREGQGKVAWKNAKEGDYKNLWTKQMDDLRVNNFRLNDIYYDGTLPDDVAKRLTVRTRLMLEANVVVTKSKFNDSTVDQLVEDGLLTWKEVDAAIRAGWESKANARTDSDFYREVNKGIEEKIQAAVDRNRAVQLRSSGGQGVLQPGVTALGDQLALRGTTDNHFGSDSILGSSYRSTGFESRDMMNRVKKQMESVYGKVFTEGEVFRMMKTVNYYTNGGYKSQISLMLQRNKPDAYNSLPSHYTGTVPTNPAEQKKRLDDIEEAQQLLAALPIYTGGPVYRGMPLQSAADRLKHLEHLTTGTVDQVISYSTMYDKAVGFSSGGDYSILFHIDNPKTLSSVRGLSNYEYEYEVLVHKYTRLRVDYVSFNKDGSDPFQLDDPRARMGKQLHVFMSEIPPDESP